jgi:uncharacterized protein YukJ
MPSQALPESIKPSQGLPGYGLLIGKIVGVRFERSGSPHLLLFVQPGNPDHPAYRVAVNLQSTDRHHVSDLQYQVVDFGGRSTSTAKALIRKLTHLGQTPAFATAASDPTIPRLDFVHGGIIDPKKFKDMPKGSNPLRQTFKKALADAKAAEKSGTLVAVFGTGYPADPQTGGSVPTGFTGIENIHMNQGAYNLINGEPYYRENGPNQDGGIILLSPEGARGFFVKFLAQTINTDANGNPTVTGIDKIDDTSAAVRKAIMPRIRRRAMAAARKSVRTSAKHAARTRPTAAPTRTATPSGKTPPSGTANGQGFLFADFDPNDSSGKYIPDDDGDTYNTPFVQTLSKGQTKGPVPTPRIYPRMDLASVVGANPPGYVSQGSTKSIAFDIIGDSGAPTQKKLDEYEIKVTELMTADAAKAPPTFCFHVGDVVYFYGEENYYYSQFYEPFKAYPAPIFAIPGNHDGMTYNASMTSLGSFQQAFCATTPGRWIGAGGILRSTLTQPGVYFTLDSPLVSIIGLYSNCGESLGWLNDAQLLFLYQELARLKALRKNGLPAVIMAIHHFPRWFPGQKDPTSTAIDAACKKAGFWPDAVICGHAHLYQRIVRQDTGQDIPYVLSGAGGYAITPGEEVGKTFMVQAMKNGTKIANKMFESGYVRATVTSPSSGDPTLRFEYRSVKPTSDAPDDVCAVNLRTNKLI